MTLPLYYGGEARHLPHDMYAGGSVDKFDYVQPNECCLETLNMFYDGVGIEKVDKVVHNEDNRDSCESSDEEEDDVVDNEGDLDEAKDSVNGEGDGPSYPVFNLEEIYDPTFELGMMFFSNKDELKKALHSHAIKSKRTLKLKKNDKIRVYAECGANDCDWKMHANKLKDEETLQINLFHTNHSCPQIFDVKNVKTAGVKEKYLQKFESDPKRLWDYADEIRKTTLGSTIIVGTEQTDGDERFSRFYVWFDAMKDGFKAGCRLIIRVDGVDPNNHLFLISYAVVNWECRETWKWFLIVLKHDQNIVRQDQFTFMSDKQKGLMQAFDELDDNVQTLPVVNEPNEGRQRKRKMAHPTALRRSNRLHSGIEPQHPNILPLA
ncbi:UNVERIFIED_CONTAM: hypothetical protein Scaly_2606400 [Sesamum calycinum]|uniref:Transposase MuDR plant domain-containing protein n=1 Tax=Sesamum calycinum TaxID=2727403 RepID=A0AAW2JBU4_9LAMI